MLIIDSTETNFLLITSSDAKRNALNTSISEIALKSTEIGLTIITIPINPMMVTKTFVMVNFSFRNFAASNKTNIGIVKLIVVATASFPEVSPKHHAAIPKNNIPPLEMCKNIREVLKLFLLVNMNGMNTIVPKKNLKKTTS